MMCLRTSLLTIQVSNDHTGQDCLLHWSTKFNFCHGSKTKWSVSGVICGAEHEFDTRNGVSGPGF